MMFQGKNGFRVHGIWQLGFNGAGTEIRAESKGESGLYKLGRGMLYNQFCWVLGIGYLGIGNWAEDCKN